MGQWSGRGIPPTRRKLHRLRSQRELELKREAKSDKAEAIAFARSARMYDRALKGCADAKSD